MTRTNRAVVIYGNDAELHIQMKRFDKGSGTFIDFDMTKTTDLTVELTCSKHATHIPLKYKINDDYHNILDCEIDWRLLHTNNSYGVIVQGYDEYDEHFRFEMLPSELFLVISNTSGLKVTDDYSETSVESITVTGAVGWGISVGDLSQYYTKNETEQYVQDELEDYYDKGETDALLDEKANSADLATVATTGSYNDLINKPIIPAGQIQSDWSQSNSSEVDYIKNKPNLATVATSGDYDDLTNKPNLSQYATQTDLAGKQDTLVSGTNIKTINNQSLLGSGNIDIQGGGGENHDNADEATANALYELNERLSEAEINIDIIPTEVQAKIDELEANVEQSLDELPPKFDEIDEEFKSTALVIEELHETAQPTLVSGTNIKTINNESILGSGNITISGSGVQSNWNETDTTSLAYIQNKPNLATVATSGSYNDLTNTPNLATVATSGDYDDLTNKPTIPAAQVQSDYNQSDNTQVDYIKNKPNLATVATSGDYDDLTNKPTIPAAQVQSDYNQSDNTQVDYIKNKPNLATVATSGNYNDLNHKPDLSIYATEQELGNYYDKGETDGLLNNKVDTSTLVNDYYNKNTVDNLLDAKADTSDLNNYYDKTETNSLLNQKANVSDLNNKQDTLVSGTNIKTINNQSLLGSGNIDVQFSQVQSDWTENDTSDPSYIQNKPNLATVATSGSYNDLTNTPNLATVATSGDYDDLTNKPTIPTTTGMITGYQAGVLTNGIKIDIVSALPANPDANTIYIVT